MFTFDRFFIFKNGKQVKTTTILFSGCDRIFAVAADNNWYFIHKNCDSRDPMIIVKFVPEKDLPYKKTLFVLNSPYFIFPWYFQPQKYKNEHINWESFVEKTNSYSIPFTQNNTLLHLRCENCGVPVAAFFKKNKFFYCSLLILYILIPFLYKTSPFSFWKRSHSYFCYLIRILNQCLELYNVLGKG